MINDGPFPSHSSVSRHQSGNSNGVVGFMIGLVSGLGIAVIVALGITHVQAPFAEKVKPLSAFVPPAPKAGGDANDPNQALYSKHSADVAAAQQQAAAQAAANGTPVNATTVDPTQSSSDTQPSNVHDLPNMAANSSSDNGGDPIQDIMNKVNPSSNNLDGGKTYILQAGAFSNSDDAEAVKARIALIGIDAKISLKEVDGKTLYRVRLGPFGSVEDLEKNRQALAMSGIDAKVMANTK